MLCIILFYCFLASWNDLTFIAFLLFFFVKAQEGTRITFLRAIQFSVMFFFPQFSKWIAGQMLGSSTNYFRKIFWNSMDTRNITKAKRGDLIDSLIDLKNENDLSKS